MFSWGSIPFAGFQAFLPNFKLRRTLQLMPRPRSGPPSDETALNVAVPIRLAKALEEFLEAGDGFGLAKKVVVSAAIDHLINLPQDKVVAIVNAYRGRYFNRDGKQAGGAAEASSPATHANRPGEASTGSRLGSRRAG